MLLGSVVKEEDKLMNILIAINEQYIRQSEIMLTSLRSAMKKEDIKVYLLYNNISSIKIQSMKDFLYSRINIELIDIKIDDDILKELPLMAHYSIEIYYRLLADSILPDNIERVLWLDSDIVITKSIEKLYYTDFEENYLAVCNDLFVGKEQLLKYVDEKKAENAIYFNSGVILFNLKKIREDRKQKDIIDFLNQNKSLIDMPDQDALNVVYFGKVKYFEGIQFNYLINGRESLKKSQKDILINTTAIIHYVGAEKPWFYKYINQSWRYYWKVEKQIGNYWGYFAFVAKHYIYIFARKLYGVVRSINKGKDR